MNEENIKLLTCFCAGKSAGHEAKHERQHFPETVQDVERAGRTADQGQRRY